LRIAQISDLHFTHLTWNPFRLFSKRVLGHANWLLSRKNSFSPGQLESLPDLFSQLKVDLVLIGGDLTTTALVKEFETAQKFVRKIKQPWIATAGNHDHYTWRSFRKKHFYRYFSNKRKELTHTAEFFNLKDHGIEAHPVKAGWWIIVLDTARATNPYSSQGLFSQQLEGRLDEVLRLIPKTDSILLMNHYPFFQNDDLRRTLKRGDVLEKKIKSDPRIRVYLHGHTHRHTIADLQANGLPLILDSGSVAMSKKGTWNLIELTDANCTVEPYRWKNGWQKEQKETIAWNRN
jgi:3',5'-cyclic AMP phosphodiesterase CpdA